MCDLNVYSGKIGKTKKNRVGVFLVKSLTSKFTEVKLHDCFSWNY